MISSSQEYTEAMKDMVRKVQKGYEPPFSADADELEILSDCIKEGYIRGRTTYIDSDGHEKELHTLDGKMHPEIINHVIPPKGLDFLDSGISGASLERRMEDMKKVLLHIQAKKPFDDLSFEEQRIFKECYDAGYFEGVVPVEMITGKIVVEYRHEPRLTLKGLEFLDSLQQKPRNEPDEIHAAKPKSDIENQSLKWSKINTIGSIVVGLLTIVATILVAKFF